MNCYRSLFLFAAAFNFVIAIWSGFAPSQFFGLFGAPVPAVLVPWGAVALLIATFGVVYLLAAWRPEQADGLITLGLATKVVGPATWLAGVAAGTDSPRLFPFIVFGDLAWSFPFAWYLLRRFHQREAWVVWLSSCLHLAACLGLLIVGPGTELQANVGERQAWVQSHLGIWTAVWMVWALSSLSLPWLIAAWLRLLWPNRDGRYVLTISLAIIATGVICDLCGEITEAAWLTRPELSADQFLTGTRCYQILSPLWANGLYCLGGLALSIYAWQLRLDQRGIWGASGIGMWLIGLSLSIATAAGNESAMTATGMGVMAIFLPWSAWLGWKLRACASSTG